MSYSRADQKLLDVYKSEFQPPAGWTPEQAKEYRRMLDGSKKGKSQLARYAPIGQMPFVDAEIKTIRRRIERKKMSPMDDTSSLKKRLEELMTMPPDSFPFIAFSTEFVADCEPEEKIKDEAEAQKISEVELESKLKFNCSYKVPDTELLERAKRLQMTMNKYDPYSTDSFEPLVKDAGGYKVPVDYIRYKENLNSSPVSVKDPAIERLKKRPKHPGAKMFIKNDVQSFQSADYDVDKLTGWLNGQIKDNSDDGSYMLKLHHAIKRHAGDYLLTLKEEFEMEKLKIRSRVDFELRNYLMNGEEGSYVNRWSMQSALKNLDPDAQSKLMNDYIISDYTLFNKVMDIDNKGYNKWKKYVNRKRKRYLRYMNTIATQVIDTDEKKKLMKPYYELNTEAENRRDMIGKIEELKEAREDPTEVKEETVEETPVEVKEDEPPVEVKEESNEPDEEELIKEVMIGDSKYYDDDKKVAGPYDLLDKFLSKRGEDTKSYLTTKGLTPVSSLSGRIDSVFQCAKDKNEIGSFKTCIDLDFLKLEKLRGTKYEEIVEDAYKRRNKLIREKKLTQKWAMSVAADFKNDRNKFTMRPICDKSKTMQFKRRMELLGFDIDWPSTMTYNKTVESDLREQLTDFEEKHFLELFTQGGVNRFLCAFDIKKILYLLSPFPIKEKRFTNYARKRINAKKYHEKAYEWSRLNFNKLTVFEPCVKIDDKIGRVIELLDDEKVKFQAFDGSESVHGLSDIKYPSKEDCKKAAAEAKTEKDKTDLDEAARLDEENAIELKFKPSGSGDRAFTLSNDDITYYVKPESEGVPLDVVRLLDGTKERDHLERVYTVKVDPNSKVFNLEDNMFRADQMTGFQTDANEKEIPTNFQFVKKYGEPLTLKDAVDDKLISNVKTITKQLKAAGICHGDIRLENLIKEDGKIRLVGFEKATKDGKPCQYRMDGDICITPPIAGKDLIDQWGIIIAILRLGKSDTFKEGLKFLCELPSNTSCDGSIDNSIDNGLFFYENGVKDERQNEREKRFDNLQNGEKKYRVFLYSMVMFQKVEDTIKAIGLPDKPNFTLLVRLFKSNEGMGDLNKKQLAERWIATNKSLEKISLQFSGQTLRRGYFTRSTTVRGPHKYERGETDLGKLLYNIPAAQIESLFKIIPSEVAGSLTVPPARVNFLDYDSFSDIELDELAAELEPLDELDVDQLLDGYDSVSDVSIAGNTYDSESEQSIGYASSYNSESEQSFGYASAYNSESEQSLAYGADYNSESEFSDGYGAYNSESEHSTSYDSESDLDR